jgi:hypothetical protein
MGLSTRIKSDDSRQSENTMNTRTSIQYHILSVKYSYYTLSLSIWVTKCWSTKDTSRMFQSLWKQFLSTFMYIPFTLKENVLPRPSMHVGPSTESNPRWFGPLIDSPHRHHRKEEEYPHLNIRYNKSKAWTTTLNKTYPLWPKDHELDMQDFN